MKFTKIILSTAALANDLQVLRETSSLLQLSPIESVEGAKWHKEVAKVLKSEELKRPISQYVNEAKKIHINSIFENQKQIFDGPSTDFRGGGQTSKIPQSLKFVNYGCYCTPDGSKNSEGGEPVDEIDQLCQQLYHAYKCLSVDYGKCPSTTLYEWKIKNNGEPTCADQKDSCAGSVCRLDMDFTEKLVELEIYWNEDYHELNGFDRKKSCVGPDFKRNTSKNIGGTGTGFSQTGVKEFSETDSHNKCCGQGLNRHVFHRLHQECCSDGTSKPAGAC